MKRYLWIAMVLLVGVAGCADSGQFSGGVGGLPTGGGGEGPAFAPSSGDDPAVVSPDGPVPDPAQGPDADASGDAGKSTTAPPAVRYNFGTQPVFPSTETAFEEIEREAWAKVYRKGGSSEELNAMIITADGGFIYSANSFSARQGSVDVVRTGVDGEVAWGKQLVAPTGNLSAGPVVLMSRDSYLVSAVWKKADSARSVVLAKVDDKGRAAWIRSYELPPFDREVSVELTAIKSTPADGGGYVLLGKQSRPMVNAVPGDIQSFLLKVRSNGEAVWSKAFSLEDGGRFEANDLFIDAFGKIWIAGRMKRNENPSYAVAIKLNETGDRESGMAFRGEADAAATAILDEGAGQVVTGTTGVGEESKTFVAKLVPGGFAFYKMFSGNRYSERPVAVTKNLYGSYFIAGTMLDENQFSRGGFLYKIDNTATNVLRKKEYSRADVTWFDLRSMGMNWDGSWTMAFDIEFQSPAFLRLDGSDHVRPDDGRFSVTDPESRIETFNVTHTIEGESMKQIKIESCPAASTNILAAFTVTTTTVDANGL